MFFDTLFQFRLVFSFCYFRRFSLICQPNSVVSSNISWIQMRRKQKHVCVCVYIWKTVSRRKEQTARESLTITPIFYLLIMQYHINSLNVILLYLSWRMQTAIIHQNYTQFPLLFAFISFALMIAKIALCLLKSLLFLILCVDFGQ